VIGTHNKQFAHVQEEYFKTRDNKYLAEMYLLCAEVAENCIRKYARDRRIRLPINDLAHDTAAYVITKYFENANFKLDPMPGYIKLCTKAFLYKDKEWNRRKVSFEDWMREQEAAV
jgi:hypothetical protein